MKKQRDQRESLDFPTAPPPAPPAPPVLCPFDGNHPSTVMACACGYLSPTISGQQTATNQQPASTSPSPLQCQLAGCGSLLDADGRCPRHGI